MTNRIRRIKGERVLGLAVLLIAAVFIWRHSFFITSTEAFINADVHNVSSPIFGELKIPDIGPGKTFNKGDSLFEVYNQRIGGLPIFTDYYDFKHRIELIQAEIRQDEVSVTKLKADLLRNEALSKIGGITKEVVRDIYHKINLLKIGLLAKERRLIKLKESLEQISAQLKLHEKGRGVTSVDCVVWAILRKNGDLVNAGDTVMQIIDTNRIWVDAFFREKDAKHLLSQTAVTVIARDNQKRWEGKILFVRKGRFLEEDISILSDVARPKKRDEAHMVCARIEVNWDSLYSAQDFYGYGKNVTALIKKNRFFGRLE